MVDKIKPLKFETSIDGTEIDFLPTEANPSEDYVSTKGVAFTNNDNYLIDSIGRTISQKEPYTTTSTTYLGNGEVDYIEYFNSDTQITTNRIYKTSFTYDGDLNPLTATTVVYDTNGTTVLRTYVETLTYTGADIIGATVSIT